ncbi:MAG: hypothetical protein LBD13_00590 [Spirochaetaceae bacterium]|jgi:hypothetical protein|nr:hypothetical protein [Spirochaetaceae bacterium]
MKRWFVWWALFSAAALGYGETLFNFNTGWSFYKEKQSDFLYYGPQFNLGTSFYPKSSPVGFFIDYLITVRSAGDNPASLENASESPMLLAEFGLAVGPSFILRVNPWVMVIFSAGTFWSISDHTVMDYGSTESTASASFSDINMGLQGDISFLFRIGKWFFFKTGVNGIWTFFKSPVPNESAEETASYRFANKNRYKNMLAPLHTLGVAPYFGLGFGFLF